MGANVARWMAWTERSRYGPQKQVVERRAGGAWRRRGVCNEQRRGNCRGDPVQRATADAAGGRGERDVPGAAHLLHRPQLRRARARDGIRPDARAAVLLSETE